MCNIIFHDFNSFAYWGVLNSNITVAREAYNQIKYYRELLRDPDTHLWKHTTNNGDWEGELEVLTITSKPLLPFDL